MKRGAGLAMGEFIDAVLSFPTALFTPLFVVVVAYWVIVVAGGSDPDSFGGFGGVPASVPISLFVTFGWLGSLIATRLLGGWAALVAVLVAALALALLLTVLIRRWWPASVAASRTDLVGRTCTIRTGRVTAEFGQAEVHARDGSSAIVQVRQAGDDALTAGTVALLYDFDPEGEFFWVVPADIAQR
jgi:hypothetical protein